MESVGAQLIECVALNILGRRIFRRISILLHTLQENSVVFAPRRSRRQETLQDADAYQIRESTNEPAQDINSSPLY